MSSKDVFNRACTELANQEQRLAKALHQINQARARAVEVAAKAQRIGSILPVSADLEKHAEAAAATARDRAAAEGERAYWCQLHQAALEQVADARVSVVQAEEAARAAENEFWATRFAEGARALFQNARDQIADCYAAYARAMGAAEPEIELFLDALIAHHAGDEGLYRRAVPASYKTMPAPPRSTAISDAVRFAVKNRAYANNDASPLREVPGRARNPADIRNEMTQAQHDAAHMRQRLEELQRDLTTLERNQVIHPKTGVSDRAAEIAHFKKRIAEYAGSLASIEERRSALGAELELAEIEHAALATPAGG